MIYNFVFDFLNTVLGQSIYNAEFAYILSSLFPLFIIFCFILIPILGKRNSFTLFTLLFIFVAVLVISYSWR